MIQTEIAILSLVQHKNIVTLMETFETSNVVTPRCSNAQEMYIVMELLRGGEEVNRKIVKQTVMTSVYGVTFVGARAQIEGQLSVRVPYFNES